MTSDSRKEPKSPKSSSKKEKSEKKSKNHGKGSSGDDNSYDGDHNYYGIGNHDDHQTRTGFHQREEQNNFRGIGYAEPRTDPTGGTGVLENR